jgi:hypothetical protein
MTARARNRRLRRHARGFRVPGHALKVTWSGEYGIESSSTGECKCGWQESASNQHEVRFEYRHHLRRVAGHTWDRDSGCWMDRNGELIPPVPGEIT